MLNQHLKIVQEAFPGALLIKPTQAGKLLNQSRQSSYNQIHLNRFPIPLAQDHLGRKMVRIVDLVEYLDTMQHIPASAGFVRKQIIGRPTKKEQIEAKRRGISISPRYKNQHQTMRPPGSACRLFLLE